MDMQETNVDPNSPRIMPAVVNITSPGLAADLRSERKRADFIAHLNRN